MSKSKEPKKAGGRRAGFTSKLLSGKGTGVMLEAAMFGDAATSRGAELCQAVLAGFDARMFKKDRDELELSRLRQDMLLERLEGAMLMNDAQLFREIADYLDARKAAKEKGPVSIAHLAAITFAEFCWYPTMRGRIRAKALKESPALTAAAKRGAFNPSVKQIHDFLNEMLADQDVPNRKTVERIAELIGTKKPSSASGLPNRHRQF